MKYGDIYEECANERHDLSDQFDISCAITVNQLPLLIAQIAIDIGLSPGELVDFLRDVDYV